MRASELSPDIQTFETQPVKQSGFFLKKCSLILLSANPNFLLSVFTIKIPFFSPSRSFPLFVFFSSVTLHFSPPPFPFSLPSYHVFLPFYFLCLTSCLPFSLWLFSSLHSFFSLILSFTLLMSHLVSPPHFSQPQGNAVSTNTAF